MLLASFREKVIFSSQKGNHSSICYIFVPVSGEVHRTSSLAFLACLSLAGYLQFQNDGVTI